MIKQRRDSIEQFTNGNRPELAAKEAAEIVVIEEFLPKALDEAGPARVGLRSRCANMLLPRARNPLPKTWDRSLRQSRPNCRLVGSVPKGAW